MKGTNKIFPFLSLLLFCILFQTKETIARSRISKFYNRFIRNAQDDPPNFIERIVNASIPRYNHYMLATTELVATDPSCRKLCPKGDIYIKKKLRLVNVSNIKNNIQVR